MGDLVKQDFYFDVDLFNHAHKVADMLSNAGMTPAHFKGSIPDCMIALEFANRHQLNPFMVMQSMYVVHGKPGLESKMLKAIFNKSGLYEKGRHEVRGNIEAPKNDQDGCRFVAVEKATGEEHAGPWITWAIAKAEGWLDKSGSKWKTIPEIMFHNRSFSWFVTRHCPELAMGMYTVDELQESNIRPVQVLPTVEEKPLEIIEHKEKPELDAEPAPEQKEEPPSFDKKAAAKKIRAMTTERGYEPDGVKAAMQLFQIHPKGAPARYPFKGLTSYSFAPDDYDLWPEFLDSLKEHHELLIQVEGDEVNFPGWADHFRAVISNKEVINPPVKKDRHLYTLTSNLIAKIRSKYIELLKAYSENGDK
jgi:hypothetical protein